MKIKKSPKSYKKLWITSLIVISALLVATAAYLTYTHFYKSDTPEHAPTTDTTEDQATGTPGPSGTLPEKTPSQDESTKNPQTETEDASLEVPTISRLSVSNNELKVVTTFQTTSSGSCRFELSSSTHADKSYTSSIVVGPSYYYCSIDVPTSELGTGIWGLTVYNVGNSGVRASESKEVTI